MKKDKIISLLLAVVGIIFVGIGIAFNATAALGNDPVGIMYDGIRSILNLSAEELGRASNIVNITLGITVLLLARQYINIGTFIYILPYGKIVDVGVKLYNTIFKIQIMPTQIVGAILGCCMLYLGVAMFIVADIGLDPFTGFVMMLRDKFRKEYRYMKICFDIACVFIGFSLGGRIGIITIVTALIAGPVIQFFVDQIEKAMKKIK